MYKLELNDPSFLPHVGCSLELVLGKKDGVIITGENGIGKTTVLHRLYDQYKSQFSITLVDQKPLDFFYDRTLGDIRKILAWTRPSDINVRIFDCLWKEFGLHLKEQRLTSALSGGEMQALKICAGMGKKAELYLLDEPFQSLDVDRKKILANHLDDLKKEGLSFLIVEHELDPFANGWRVQPLVIENGSLNGGKSWTI